MKYSFDDLVKILEMLRSENGCPWDKAQNTRSLLPYLIEESYEFIDAAQKGSYENMQEELGDVLLQVVFHAEVCKEKGIFNIQDVIQGICEKMVRRHPHVFGNAVATDSSAVSKQWEAIKAEEKAKTGNVVQSAMDKVPKGLPSLFRAQELQRRAAKSGFDWQHAKDSIEKVLEEFREFAEEKQVAPFPSKERLEEELGDIIFSLTNYARHCGLNVDTALARSNAKFEKRFRTMENMARNQELKKLPDSELLSLWKKAKECLE